MISPWTTNPWAIQKGRKQKRLPTSFKNFALRHFLLKCLNQVLGASERWFICRWRGDLQWRGQTASVQAALEQACVITAPLLPLQPEETTGGSREREAGGTVHVTYKGCLLLLYYIHKPSGNKVCLWFNIWLQTKNHHFSEKQNPSVIPQELCKTERHTGL